LSSPTPSTPSLYAQRTALAWQRSGLALVVVAALFLRHGDWPAIASAVAVGAGAALTARRHLDCRALALVTVGAALLAAATVIATR
jgi:hypothetical protein